MRKLYTWRKEGDWEIYEGRYAIAVGYDNKYDCFGSKLGNRTPKGKVRWDARDLYFKPSTNVYVGQYIGKNKAKNIIDRIDVTLESDKVMRIESSDKLVPSQSLTLNTKKKGVVIVYPKDDIVERLHEEGHIKADVYKTNRSFHYNDELKAIQYQIAELNKRKIWNSKTRNKIINDLSTYNRKTHPKRERAARDIKRIEAGLGLL
jgi:hypothetical protein